MPKILLSFLLTIISFLVAAQSNKSNDALYWKNRKPHAAYWQQDVAYNIDASIDENTHQINAAQKLKYTNNSPDTLQFVYFHLFQNAFVKDAYTRNLEKANKIKPRLGDYEAQGLGIEIENLQVDGGSVKTELDNTILKVFLNQPLLPGKSIIFSMDFNTYFDRGSTRRRMQMYDAWGFMHYNGCQWFPKICVYDAKFGWDTYQHLGKEFYGDFGTFSVTLDFASNYIVEATGAIQNREEVLPKDLREKLDLKNFADKPWDEKPSIIIPYNKGERKKWKFYAEHVHDFAFTADPSYRIGTAYWNGIECAAIAQEPHASGWQNGAALVAEIIKTFSENYGLYHYPKMVAADARDGMEYPMITMDGGKDPGYRGLLVHEIAHNWFYGMVGSNETYRAAMDEGLTQFLTAEGLLKIDGEVFKEEPPKSWWRRQFAEPKLAKDVRVYNTYIADAANGNDHQINTHSDDFNSALGHGGGYRLVYYKTAAMLYNLQYVLGDSLFSGAMKHYVHQWKFAHPYFEDFRNSIIQYTKVDLNWFFDQWIETTKGLDYSIGKLKKVKHTDSFDISIKRKGEMQMPIDFTITGNDGERTSFHISNNWFEKKTAATILPRWIGWGKLQQTYTARIASPQGIKHVELDTTLRLADRNMLDNYKTKNVLISPKKIKVKWDGGITNSTDWKHYRVYVRPDIWYNAIDGVKLGMHFEGAYLHNFLKADGAVWLNTQIGQWSRYKTSDTEYGVQKWVNYTLNLQMPLSRSMPNVTTFLNTRFLDGLWYHRLGAAWTINDNNFLQLSVQTFHRNSGFTNYLLYQNHWSSDASNKNNSLNISYTRNYQYHKGFGNFILSLRTPVLSNAFNYSYAELESVNTRLVHKMLVRTRVYARYGLGDNLPRESMLYLAGANPEEMMDNKYVRSMAFVPNSWLNYSRYATNHFQYGGGLNMRGYNGYFATDERNGDNYLAYFGRSGASLNAEIDFSNYCNFKPVLTRNWLSVALYAFADAGIIELQSVTQVPPTTPNYQFSIAPSDKVSDFRFDAGVGTAITIKKWGVFDKAKPLTIRFDMPLFLNRPNYNNPQYFAPRWLVGVSRAF